MTPMTRQNALRALMPACLAALAALVLSGCGVRGGLERPPPIWGEDSRSEEERAYEEDEDGR